MPERLWGELWPVQVLEGKQHLTFSEGLKREKFSEALQGLRTPLLWIDAVGLELFLEGTLLAPQ